MTSLILRQLLAGPANAAVTAALTPDDWRLLAQAARQEGVAPFLYHSLNKAGWPEVVPPEVQSDLRRTYYAATAANLLIYRQLTRVLVALATPGRNTQYKVRSTRHTTHNPKSEGLHIFSIILPHFLWAWRPMPSAAFGMFPSWSTSRTSSPKRRSCWAY